jgi:hypothetical protein
VVGVPDHRLNGIAALEAPASAGEVDVDVADPMPAVAAIHKTVFGLHLRETLYLFELALQRVAIARTAGQGLRPDDEVWVTHASFHIRATLIYQSYLL